MIGRSEIDVNVHPSKEKIRYTNPNQIFNFAFSSIKAALESNGITAHYAGSTNNDFNSYESQVSTTFKI